MFLQKSTDLNPFTACTSFDITRYGRLLRSQFNPFRVYKAHEGSDASVSEG